MQIKKNFPLKKFTTMSMGGPARFFVTVKNERDLLAALKFAKSKKLPWHVVGEGSNLIVNDQGFTGVIIHNKIQKFDLTSHSSPRQERRVILGAGNNLLKTISKLNKLGRAGMERMAGIPGTIGGAIYGCAGAYGQEIKDHLKSVRIFDGKKLRTLTRAQCQFGYRSSVFKTQKKWIITEATFAFPPGRPAALRRISRDTIKLREKKYWPGLKCPGSFFKNIKISDLKPIGLRYKFLRLIPREQRKFGKIPTGYLLERIGAKGMSIGSIKVASHHANLIYNPHGGKARDVKKLAIKLRKLVKNKFGIIIEEEVQYL